MAPVKVYGGICALFICVSVATAQLSEETLQMIWKSSVCEIQKPGRKCHLNGCPSGWVSDPDPTTSARLYFNSNYLLCFGYGACCIQTDEDECFLNTHTCHGSATCTNTVGSFTCACNSGFSGDGTTCTDINECETGTPCGTNAACSNNAGSFTCSCPFGYQGDPYTGCTDINECTSGTATCDANASCSNTGGSYTCTCNTGFTGNGFTCADINECNPGTACGSNAACDNNFGSYTCTCYSGYEGNPYTGCVDIDECTRNTDNCADTATCFNYGGGFACLCPPGTAGSPTVSCSDVNECDLGTDDCHTDATCSNTDGSYTCACNTGFSGDGVTCSDIDECLSGTHCASGASCQNTIGSYLCSCPPGYSGNPSTSCVDIDECALNQDQCDLYASCSNTVGSYGCACNDGFRGDGFTCTDIDECVEKSDDCVLNAVCTNIPGSFTCSCAPGFSGDGKVSCTDIDECMTNTDNCASIATCDNNQGSYTCTCPVGYTGNGITCDDIDECLPGGGHNCDANAACANIPGSFTCTCNDGYFGDGVTCTNTVNHPDCGIPPTIKIGFGTIEAKCMSPWQISFRAYVDPTDFTQTPNLATSLHLGAGVLVQSKWVLTTPFSLLRAGRIQLTDPYFNLTMFAVAGEYNILLDDTTEQLIPVKRVIFHPLSRFRITDDFVSLLASLQVNTEDITDIQQEYAFALVELAQEVTIDNCARPACIPTELDYPMACGSPMCKITGWGHNEELGFNSLIQKADVQMFDPESCEAIKYYRANGTYVAQPRTTQCALNADGARPCLGDFGGPAVCEHSAGRYVVEGLTLMETVMCSSTPYTPFNVARVRDVTDWIETTIRSYP